METKIYFNPEDHRVRRFLEICGFSEKVITTGEIDSGTSYRANINFDTLTVIARADDDPLTNTMSIASGEVYDTLTGEEAERFFSLTSSSKREIMASLLVITQCPGSGMEARRIAANVLGVPHPTYMGSIDPATCPYSDHSLLGVRELIGVDYGEAQLPPHRRDPGKAVHYLRMKETVALSSGPYEATDQGSAVLVSDKGDFVSAYHVFFDKDSDEFRHPTLYLESGMEIQVTPDHVTFADKKRDLVRFKIPEARGRPFVPVSASPPAQGDAVWIIGFPGGQIRPESRRYTLGRVLSYSQGTGQIELDAEVVGGYSGGLILKDGELVGVASGAHMTSYAGLASIVHKSFGYYPSSE